MQERKLLIGLVTLLYLMIAPSLAEAATISICTLNKEVYNQGETGYITVTIYNDEDNKIRVTELTARIDYYYADENVYLQTFYTDATLPVEIQPGQSGTLQIPFSLPTNIAPGYIDVYVKAKTEMWNNNGQTWQGSDHPTYYPTLYVESPYKGLLEGVQASNDQLANQLEELQAVNATTTNIMYLLGVTGIAFAMVTVFLIMFIRKAKVVTRAAA